MAAIEGRTRLRCEDRVAWLLRTNRVYGPDEVLATGARFARAFRGGGFHREIDGAQVTRWEKATQRAGYLAIRRYEQLLGFARHRLVGIVDGLYRSARYAPGGSYLDRGLDGGNPQLRQRTEELIEQAVSCARMSGGDWDELTSNLLAMPAVFLYPSKIWSEVASRLLAEMVIADGSDWYQRSEALQRLLGHPTAEPVVIAACAALVADADNQVFVDPLSLLGWSAHPDAARLIVSQVTNPTNSHALRGAWWSAAEKLSHGHFAPRDVHLLRGRAVELLMSDEDDPACRLAAAESLRHSGLPTDRSRASAMRKITADRLSRHIVHSGRLASPEAVAAITGRIAMTAAAMLERDAPADDPVMRRLLEEMLFHPQISTRTAASRLVEATPYRFPIARALFTELGNRSVLEDQGLAPAMIHAVGVLGDSQTHRRLQQLILTSGVPGHIVETAVWVLGHGLGAPTDHFWVNAIGRYRGRPSSLRGIVYGLGLTRRVAMLHACRADASLPGEARTAARWWLNRPSHVLDSTDKADR